MVCHFWGGDWLGIVCWVGGKDRGVLGTLLVNTDNGVNNFVARYTTGSGRVRVITNFSGVGVNRGCPIFSDFNSVGIGPSIVVSFSGITLLSSVLSCTIGGGVPTILTAAKCDSRRVGRVGTATGRVPVFFAFGVSVNMGLLYSLTGGTTTILKASFSIRVVRGRRGLGVSTPSNATVVLTGTMGRRFGSDCGCRCSHRSGHTGEPGGRVNVRSMHNKAVINRRSIVFTNHSRAVALSRRTASGRMFTINTVHTTGFITSGRSNLCSVGSVVAFWGLGRRQWGDHYFFTWLDFFYWGCSCGED